jgi:multicomponent Na+:H+ antiporter subunit A
MTKSIFASNNLVVLGLLFPLAGALVCLLCGKRTGQNNNGKIIHLVSSICAFLSFAIFVLLIPLMKYGTPYFSVPWVPYLGVNFSLSADGFGLFFALLVSFVGVVVTVYSIGYLGPRDNAVRFFSSHLLFMGSMLGLVLSDDLICLFIFWELTSISSFFLIGFWHEKEDVRRSAFKALIITAVGGLCLMAGVILLGLVSGTFSLSHITAAPAALKENKLLLPAVILVLMAIFTKSAQVPFHIWLPSAMVAPTPVSCYLHAAAMVKAGIYLAARFNTLFANTDIWIYSLITFGVVTWVMGAILSFMSNDIKRLLAYATVAFLGNMVALYGAQAQSAFHFQGTFDLLQILSHASYKGSLFLIAGIIEHFHKTRDIRSLGGLKSHHPVTFWIAVLACASMAGIPPTCGFFAKESAYSAFLGMSVVWRLIVSVLGVFANAMLTAAALKLIFRVFLGRATSSVSRKTEPWLLVLPPVALLVPTIAGGYPGFRNYLESFSTTGNPATHVFPPMVIMMSIVTFAAGIFIFLTEYLWDRIRKTAGNALRLISPERLYEASDRLINILSLGLTRFTQSGSLGWYLRVIIPFIFGLAAVGFLKASVPWIIQPGEVGLKEIVVLLFLLISTITVLVSRTRLMAVLSLSACGYTIAVIYAIFRSPDILLTQLVIESVSLVLFLLVFLRIKPMVREHLSTGRFLGNVSVSAIAGIVTASLLLLCTSSRAYESIAGYFMENSLPLAGGRNLVNVIIVDFRSIDTMVETTVLGIASLGAYAVLRSGRNKQV